MTEIKKELKQDNVSIKANAVSKLTYVSLNWFWPVLYLVLVGLASGCFQHLVFLWEPYAGGMFQASIM